MRSGMMVKSTPWSASTPSTVTTRAAAARDARAHGVEHVDGHLDLGLGGGVDDGGGALGEGGGEEDVHGAEDAGVVEEDARPDQPRGARDVLLPFALHVGAEGLEAGEVHVERADADDVAAGGRAGGLAEAGEQRAHDEEGGAQGGDLVGRGGALGDVARLDVDDVALDGDLRAEDAEHRGHLADVGDGGDVAQRDGLGGHEAGGERVERGVLGAGDGDAPSEGAAAADDDALGGLRSHGWRIPDACLGGTCGLEAVQNKCGGGGGFRFAGDLFFCFFVFRRSPSDGLRRCGIGVRASDLVVGHEGRVAVWAACSEGGVARGAITTGSCLHHDVDRDADLGGDWCPDVRRVWRRLDRNDERVPCSPRASVKGGALFPPARDREDSHRAP